MAFLALAGAGAYITLPAFQRVSKKAIESRTPLARVATVARAAPPALQGMSRSDTAHTAEPAAKAAEALPEIGKQVAAAGVAEQPTDTQKRPELKNPQASDGSANKEGRDSAGPVASTAASDLVAAAISGDIAGLQKTVAELKTQQPARGNRPRARQPNDEGLALFRNAHYAEAAAVFAQANVTDKGDAEIRENLGYSLRYAGELAAAERALLLALEIGPQRATAWGSLGHIYAKRGMHRQAVALLLTAYRFAPDRKKRSKCMRARRRPKTIQTCAQCWRSLFPVCRKHPNTVGTVA
jgi:tetratricopeptide (TPR) repeat protein